MLKKIIAIFIMVLALSLEIWLTFAPTGPIAVEKLRAKKIAKIGELRKNKLCLECGKPGVKIRYHVEVRYYNMYKFDHGMPKYIDSYAYCAEHAPKYLSYNDDYESFSTKAWIALFVGILITFITVIFTIFFIEDADNLDIGYYALGLGLLFYFVAYSGSVFLYFKYI